MQGMPRIRTFFGIVNHDVLGRDHPLPHFHARYGSQSASIGIEPLTLLAGLLPPRVLGQVFEWAALYQGELLSDWELVTSRQIPVPIPPLA